MKDVILGIIVIVMLVVSFILVVKEKVECNARGGVYIEGALGFECLEGKK